MILIFDYDGTLHRSDVPYIPAFRKVCAGLVERGMMPAHTFNDDEIAAWLGYPVPDMWERFAPQLPDEVKHESAQAIGDEMRRLVMAGHSKLYDGVPEMLDELKKQGHTLVFLSNCQHRYMREHARVFGLDRWFSGYFCCEDFGWADKADICATIIERFGTSGVDPVCEFVIIGDRFHDIEAALCWGFASIGCAYGFGSDGELRDASVVVNAPSEICAALRQLGSQLAQR